jgi:hypothetical protein
MEIVLLDGKSYNFAKVKVTPTSAIHFNNCFSESSEATASMVWLFSRSLQKSGYTQDEIENIFEEGIDILSSDKKSQELTKKLYSLVAAGEIIEEKK